MCMLKCVLKLCVLARARVYMCVVVCLCDVCVCVCACTCACACMRTCVCGRYKINTSNKYAWQNTALSAKLIQYCYFFNKQLV